VRYVEDFVACFVFTQSPQSRAPEQLCVCCLLKSIPSLLGAGKAQGQPEFAAHRSIGRKAGNQVHWRVYAWSHDQMGTQDGPAVSVLSRRLSDDVFLLVVVDQRNETWLSLLIRSVEGPKTETVRLGTAGKHDALKGHTARGKTVERILQHSGIRLNRFRHRGFLDVGSEDQICHVIER